MLKRLISLMALVALSISAVNATAADQKHSSVASILSSKKKNQDQDRESLERLTPGQLRHCTNEYNRCQSGGIPNIAYHQCYAAFRYCQGQNGIFDLPGGAANHHW